MVLNTSPVRRQDNNNKNIVRDVNGSDSASFPWNINGLVRKLTDTDFINLVSSYDIMLLNETWISKNDNINLDIQGYTSEHLFGNKSTGTKKDDIVAESRSTIKTS